ncbi:MAG: SCP2 sterol-binding domain-containing protein [Deltaproteobacteria bacterium]|nr:SCP2 sterol-binding domain-containing protein [Deltaproteobacteria bacterium]
MTTLHQLKTGEPQDITPEQFFSDICPKILEAQKEPCAKLGGTYGIQLFGERGGAWTLDFPRATVNNGIGDKVDLYLEMDAEDFASMMKGKLDIEAAARAGKIRFNGDARLFGNLAAVLLPAEG